MVAIFFWKIIITGYVTALTVACWSTTGQTSSIARLTAIPRGRDKFSSSYVAELASFSWKIIITGYITTLTVACWSTTGQASSIARLTAIPRGRDIFSWWYIAKLASCSRKIIITEHITALTVACRSTTGQTSSITRITAIPRGRDIFSWCYIAMVASSSWRIIITGYVTTLTVACWSTTGQASSIARLTAIPRGRDIFSWCYIAKLASCSWKIIITEDITALTVRWRTSTCWAALTTIKRNPNILSFNTFYFVRNNGVIILYINLKSCSSF
jgi:hypothetical protein